MKIQFCSDLHLEFAENNKLLRKEPLIPSADILILAGDIVPFKVYDKYSNFFDYVSNNFETVYWLPGNHEYYGSDISERSGTLNEKIRNNVILVNNQSIINKDVRLIFSTLWSSISPAQEFYIQQNISDFSVIRNKGRKFTASDYNILHHESLNFLTKSLNETHQSTIVVTHHVPTFMNYPEQFKESPLTQAFATEQFDLIEMSKIDYWIYGHSHCNTPAFFVGDTMLVTNQLGYIRYGEHKSFKKDSIIEI